MHAASVWLELDEYCPGLHDSQLPGFLAFIRSLNTSFWPGLHRVCCLVQCVPVKPFSSWYLPTAHWAHCGGPALPLPQDVAGGGGGGGGGRQTLPQFRQFAGLSWHQPFFCGSFWGS